MKRFFERCQRKALQVDEAPVLIVAFGDSVTQGTMEKDVLDPTGVYHNVLQRKLEAFYPTTTFSTINAGVSGSSAPQALRRLQRDVLSHTPDLVVIAFGLNDACSGVEGIGEFQTAIVAMIEEVRARTDADLLILTPPLMARQMNDRIHPAHLDFAPVIIQAQTSGSLSSYAECLRQIGRDHGVLVADVFGAFSRLDELGVPLDEWLVNGLNHPNRQGHELIAETAWLAIRGSWRPE